MRIQEIGIELNEALGQLQRNAQNMCPYEVASFLNISREALVKYIRNSNDQLGEDALGFVPPIEIEKIDSIFRALIDDFFPMAHTNRPLGELKIIEIDKIRMIEMFLLESNEIEARRRDLSDRCLTMIRGLDLHW